jgi:uncharacterized protein
MYFDALLHPAALRLADVEALRFFGVAGALVPSGDAFHPATAARLRDHWSATAASARSLRARGVAAWAALGIHPRRIPRRGLAERLADLPAWLDRPEVAAIGPAGLALGGPFEEEVFLAQARLAAELRLPLLVRNAARGRERLLRRVLKLLDESRIEPARVLVADADARALPLLRARGHRALVTMPGKGGVEEAARLVGRHGPHGIVLGSDAGEGGGDPLALPRVADRLARLGLSVALIRRVCLLNGLDWLGVGPESLEA